MTAPARITQADISRAIKAFRAVGVMVTGGRLEPDGSVTLLTGPPEAANDRANPLDRVLGR